MSSPLAHSFSPHLLHQASVLSQKKPSFLQQLQLLYRNSFIFFFAFFLLSLLFYDLTLFQTAAVFKKHRFFLVSCLFNRILNFTAKLINLCAKFGGHTIVGQQLDCVKLFFHFSAAVYKRDEVSKTYRRSSMRLSCSYIIRHSGLIRMKFDAQNSNIEVIADRSNSGHPGLFTNSKMAGLFSFELDR